MIFNYTILGMIRYGNTPVFEGSVTITYYPADISTEFSKTIVLDSAEYQFNLGDHDLLSTAATVTKNDYFVIEYSDINGNKIYSNGKQPDLINSYEVLDIDLNTAIPETQQTAKIKQTNQYIKTTNYFFYEDSQNLYNYYRVEKNGTLDSETWGDFKFTPSETATYIIRQRSVDKTSKVTSEDSYGFNAIVSASYIDSNSQCKSLNDTATIFFIAEDIGDAPIMRVRDNSNNILAQVAMTQSKPGVWRYDWLFSDPGYILFEIDSDGERFLQSFRVENKNFRLYYADEYLRDWVSPLYKVFSITDPYTAIKSGVMTSISGGTYTSPEWNDLQYGEYIVEIEDETYRVNYRECLRSILEGANGATAEVDDSVYWIFPQTYEA